MNAERAGQTSPAFFLERFVTQRRFIGHCGYAQTFPLYCGVIAAISKFVVSNGLESEVRNAFINRPRKVESAPGFIRLEVLSPNENASEFWLVTYWESQSAFDDWHKNHRHESHEMIPKGLKLDPRGTELRIFNHIAS